MTSLDKHNESQGSSFRADSAEIQMLEINNSAASWWLAAPVGPWILFDQLLLINLVIIAGGCWSWGHVILDFAVLKIVPAALLSLWTWSTPIALLGDSCIKHAPFALSNIAPAGALEASRDAPG